MAKTIDVTISHAGGKLIITNGDGASSYCDKAIFEYRGRSIPIKGGRLSTVKANAEKIRAGLDIELDRLARWNCVL